MTKNEVPPQIRQAIFPGSGNKNDKSKWIDANFLKHLNILEIPKLWNPIFPQIGVVGIIGPSDVGKSTFAKQLAIAIVSKETDFLGNPLNPKRCSVLYVSPEDGEEAVSSIMNKQAKDSVNDKNLTNLHFLFDGSQALEDIDEMLTEKPCDLVIIDPWSDVFFGNTNHLTEVRQNVSQFRELAVKHSTLILLIHHTSKNAEKYEPNKNRSNGSQGFEAKLRSLIDLREGKGDDERLLTIVKSNYLSKEIKKQAMVLNLDSETLLFSNTGKKQMISSPNEKNTKYDKEVWLKRYTAIKSEFSTLSIEDIIGKLEKIYEGESVPRPTWFKENLKKPVNPSLPLTNDRPTESVINKKEGDEEL
jgi:energy-coupling factor transporter ATP-binding protein EcfA2